MKYNILQKIKSLLTYVGGIGLLILSHSTMLNAQELVWGEVQKSKYNPILLGESDKAVFTSEQTKKLTYNFCTVDKTTNYTNKFFNTFEIPKESGILTRTEGMRVVGDYYVFAISYYQKATKQFRIELSAYDKNTGTQVIANQEIFKAEVEGRGKRGRFDIISSEDQSKLLIVHDVFSKKQNKRIRKYVLLDDKLKTLMEKEVDSNENIPYHFLIDNDGSIFYAGWDQTTGLYIASFDAFKEYEHWKEDIQLEGQKTGYAFGSGRLSINAQNELVFAGYFSSPTQVKAGKKRTRLELRGCYFIRIDNESKEQVVAKLSYFDNKFLDQFKTARQKKKGKSSNAKDNYNRNMSMLDLKNGGIVLTGESYSYYRYEDQNGAVRGETFNYGSIVSIHCDKDGNLKWAHRIPKSQQFSWNYLIGPIAASSRGLHLLYVNTSKYIRNYSFVSGLIDGKLVISFYDDKKNPNEYTADTKTKTMNNVTSATLRKCTIDIKNGTKKMELFEGGNDKVTYMIPYSSLQSEEGADIVFYSRKGGKTRYGVIK